MENLTEEFINELFEHPRELTQLPSPPEDVQNKIGISGLHQYIDKDGEKFIKYRRGKAWEFHHMDNIGNSGFISKKSNFNPSFIATIMDMAKPHIINGEILRISASHSLIDKYHRIASMFAKKHNKRYVVGDIMDHPTDNDKKMFHIQPKIDEGLMLVLDWEFKNTLCEWAEKFDS